MVTTKPFSAVSYNTPLYLETVLDSLVSAHKVEFWAYICHMPEDDEGGLKEHIHLYVEPSKRIDTSLFRDEFKEYDPHHPDKPLGLLPCRSSKFQDWYMYALHDREYLAQKAETRKYHYKRENVVTSDDDALNYLIKTIDLSDLSPVRRMKQFAEAGMTFDDAVTRGLVPLPQLSNYQKLWQIITTNPNDDKTDRNGRPGHDLDSDSKKDD